MKIAKCFFLSMLLFSIAGCSLPAAKTEVAVNTGGQENINATAQNADNSTEVPPVDSAAGAQAQQAVQPEAVVKDLYKTHDKQYGAILNSKSRSQIDKYFDKNLGNLIWKDLTTHEGEIGVIDFDPFYNTQDPNIKNLSVSDSKIDGSRATVPVSFTNSGRKETVTYSLVQQNSAWKISDIKYADGGSLLKYFKENAAQTSTTEQTTGGGVDGNFEGTYQVGTTTAVVKPIKMAFELKWAKGAGTMIFFYEGQSVLKFVSEDTGNGVDAFIFFDDDSYTGGTFIRGSDGKKMPVKKIR